MRLKMKLNADGRRRAQEESRSENNKRNSHKRFNSRLFPSGLQIIDKCWMVPHDIEADERVREQVKEQERTSGGPINLLHCFRFFSGQNVQGNWRSKIEIKGTINFPYFP